jgi:hypothetical protein
LSKIFFPLFFSICKSIGFQVHKCQKDVFILLIMKRQSALEKLRLCFGGEALLVCDLYLLLGGLVILGALDEG